MTYPTIKRHWTTEYEDYNNYQHGAVPLDLHELIRALTYQKNLRNGEPEDKLLTPESFQANLAYYSQHGDKLDAYRYYYHDKFCMTVGIRCGNEGDNYFSPHLTWEVASKFDLDPMNRDAPIPVYPKLTASKIKELRKEKEKYEEIFNSLYSSDLVGKNMQNYKGDTLQERIDRLIQIKNAWIQTHRIESIIYNDGQPKGILDDYIADDEDIIQFVQLLASYIPEETLNEKKFSKS